MALHGGIEVNSQHLGMWSARRAITDHESGINLYECVVSCFRPGGEVLDSEVFTVTHRYADGALALAAKVLTEATTRIAVREELEDEEGAG